VRTTGLSDDLHEAFQTIDKFKGAGPTAQIAVKRAADAAHRADSK
jgi:hypothetical protein